MLVKGEILETIQAGGGFHHGFTYSHHPVVAAAGVAVTRYVERHGLVERAHVQGAYLQEKLQRLLDLPAVGDVRGLGLMAAVELVQERKSKTPYPATAHIAQNVQAEALRRGVNVYASGGQVDGEGDLVMVGPPLVVEREQIDEVVAVLGDAIAAVTRA